jgi:hypothetical protein
MLSSSRVYSRLLGRPLLWVSRRRTADTRFKRQWYDCSKLVRNSDALVRCTRSSILLCVWCTYGARAWYSDDMQCTGQWACLVAPMRSQLSHARRQRAVARRRRRRRDDVRPKPPCVRTPPRLGSQPLPAAGWLAAAGLAPAAAAAGRRAAAACARAPQPAALQRRQDPTSRQRGFCDARCSRRILQPPAMQPCMNTTCWLARLRCNRCSGMGSRRLPAYDVLVLDLVQAGIAAQVLVDDVPVRLY